MANRNKVVETMLEIAQNFYSYVPKDDQKVFNNMTQFITSTNAQDFPGDFAALDISQIVNWLAALFSIEYIVDVGYADALADLYDEFEGFFHVRIKWCLPDTATHLNNCPYKHLGTKSINKKCQHFVIIYS